MKKMKFFAALCLMMIAASVSAQNVTPIQLKEARMAAYKWVRDYNVYARMEGKRNPAQNFIDLFEDESTQIFNDYLPFVATRGNVITVKAYASILANREPVYKMSFEIKNAKITAEEIDDDKNIVFTIEFDKTVSFQERGNTSDALYAYPYKSYHATVRVKYNLHDEKAVAGEITSNALFEDILVLHDSEAEFVNRYTSHNELKRECKSNESSLVKWNYASTDFDPQMVYLYQDTIKNSFHFGGAIGGAFYSANLSDSKFTSASPKAGLNYAFSVGYYRQLVLKNKNRFGLDFSIAFDQKNFGLTMDAYHESYDAIDPDGGEYLRLVDLNKYSESIKRFAVDVPIAFRYDYFIKDNLSFFAKVGADVSYDIAQEASASANAMYSGYYSWLFDVTMNQNGIYDFGFFDIEGSAKETGINRLGVGVFMGIGLQYFIPRSQWSFDASLQYRGEVYNKLSRPDNFHLTENSVDWKSASYLFGSYFGQNIQFQLSFNYNF